MLTDTNCLTSQIRSTCARTTEVAINTSTEAGKSGTPITSQRSAKIEVCHVNICFLDDTDF